MDQYNWLIAEILVQQRQRQLEALPMAAPERPSNEGVRRSVANVMVRLGLRIDPHAGERLVLAHAAEGRR